MSDILDRIIATKHEEVALRKTHTSVQLLKERAAEVEAPRGFCDALQRAALAKQPGVIAEIKKKNAF